MELRKSRYFHQCHLWTKLWLEYIVHYSVIKDYIVWCFYAYMYVLDMGFTGRQNQCLLWDFVLGVCYLTRFGVENPEGHYNCYFTFLLYNNLTPCTERDLIHCFFLKLMGFIHWTILMYVVSLETKKSQMNEFNLF